MSDQAGSRILVISPTAARAHQLVERVQALSSRREGAEVNGSSGAPEKQAQTSVSTNKDPLAAGSSTSIPWTIANKYYTAEVHFETHEYGLFKVQHAIGVPAIIYVWGPGDPYKEHIPEIAQKVQHYDPEVSLAVRLGGDVEVTSPAEPSVDDDGLDEFLSTHGFEFVEGDRSYRRPTQDADRHSDDEDSGIPGLPRVIDALSTIMWPSLVQSEATKKRKSRARDLIGWALEEEGDDGLRALIANPSASASSHQAGNVPVAAAARKSRMQREMEELERWLDDEESSSGVKYSRGKAEGQPAEEDAAPAAADEEARHWVTSAPVSSAEGWEDMMTPPAIRTPRSFDSPHDDASFEHGFEDDFADFVSASSHPHLQPHGLSDDRLLEVHYDVGRLTPMHTGTSYRSLGSMSDFGGDESFGPDYRYLDGDDEDDPDLPSRAEVLATSRRLFGASAFVPAPSSSTSTGPDTSSARDLTSSALPTLDLPQPQHSLLADSSMDNVTDTEDGDESFAAFDLSRVFSALQGMKDEIAGMKDEDERRRAAARVALGLVYGLGVGGDRPEQGGLAGVGEGGGGA
ncbi:hypothetical protein DICSQDRAFT_154032 [Dichomitus squalens LYAD-421 SS1]|uniref:uncharacterized protein n=1 Tax=Dichomitus squalens (strain LYAD-421) TaxID=732165 RepID=UPI00044154CE|nr:uncharacterized protein DICSQDRAFT_154032 [Dichomitus squalens LYAD-421 SS1]EJF63549.1 hypothetical protein DICSQDRAFT_154032 [Dichomitus squalens LYAD-421 SS1]